MLPITVFTPTYNRAHTLRRLYKSLIIQDHTLFEWLVIDDGSNDNTQDLLKELKIESPFPMRWIYKENGGKHRAHNVAVKMAKGELTIIMDSDDAFTENAISVLWEEWQSIPKHDQNNYAGIWGNCVDHDGQIFGEPFPRDRMDGKIFSLTNSGQLVGEKLPCFRTDILRHFPFPVLPGNSEYVPEGIVWLLISEKHMIRFINYSVRVYHQDIFDKDSLLNKTRNPLTGAWGKMIYCITCINLFENYFPKIFIIFIKMGINISRYGYHAKIRKMVQLTLIKNIITRLIWLFFLPFGFIMYKKDKFHFR